MGKSTGVATGTIKRIVADKGFGFIESNGDEFFFHRSAVIAPATFEDLHEGASVEFERGQGPKGPRAENVRTV